MLCHNHICSADFCVEILQTVVWQRRSIEHHPSNIFSLTNLGKAGWTEVLAFASRLFLFFVFLRQSLALLPSLECSGVISAHYSLHLLGLIDSPASTSWVAGTTGTYCHAWLIFVFLVEMGFHHVSQMVLISWPHDPSASASQSAGITGVSHCGQSRTWF